MMPNSANKTISGFTLVELMIALLLGTFLTGGLLKMFLDNRQFYRMTEGQSRVQEAARFGLELLTNDIRMAGYSGCNAGLTPNDRTQPQNPNPNPDFIALPLVAISGTDNNAVDWSTNACGAANGCIVNTDSITVQYAASCSAHLSGSLAANNANIKVPANNTCNAQKYDVLMIADCASADIFIATAVSNSAGMQTIVHANNQNTSSDLSKAYGVVDSEVYVMQSFTYFLRTGASGQPALWRLDNSKASPTAANPVELIEGVENMQILYGVDTNANGVADRYLVASNAMAWNNVVSVRLHLLIRTLTSDTQKNVVFETQCNDTTNDAAVCKTANLAFPLPAQGGATVNNWGNGAPDRLLRAFTTTVDIRNR